MTEEQCRKDLNKLKSTWYHDILTEGEWFARSEEGYDSPLVYQGSQWYFARNNIGNKASNYFQQENYFYQKFYYCLQIMELGNLRLEK